MNTESSPPGPISDEAIAAEADSDRISILRAINRLLSGDVARKLTVSDLAEEAGVKRYVLYQTHPDLREVWQRELDNSDTATEPPVITRLREDLTAAKELSADRLKRIGQLEERLTLYAHNLAVAVARIQQLEGDLSIEPPDDGIPRAKLRSVPPA